MISSAPQLWQYGTLVHGRLPVQISEAGAKLPPNGVQDGGVEGVYGLTTRIICPGSKCSQCLVSLHSYHDSYCHDCGTKRRHLGWSRLLQIWSANGVIYNISPFENHTPPLRDTFILVKDIINNAEWWITLLFTQLSSSNVNTFQHTNSKQVFYSKPCQVSGWIWLTFPTFFVTHWVESWRE